MAEFLQIIENYTLEQFWADLLITGLAYGYILVTVAVPVFFQKRKMVSKFIARKTIHLFTGLIVLIVPFFTLSLHAVFIALTLTIAVYFSSKDSSVRQLQELYRSIGEAEEEKAGRLQGPLYYSLSITLLITLFTVFAPDRLYFPICGILIMIISDSLASVVGKKYGRVFINITYTKTVRSLEGSLVFFGSALMLCFLAFSYFGLLNTVGQKELTLGLVLSYSLITAGAGTIIELLSLSSIDDLTVPVGTTMVIYLLSLFS